MSSARLAADSFLASLGGAPAPVSGSMSDIRAQIAATAARLSQSAASAARPSAPREQPTTSRASGAPPPAWEWTGGGMGLGPLGSTGPAGRVEPPTRPLRPLDRLEHVDRQRDGFEQRTGFAPPHGYPPAGRAERGMHSQPVEPPRGMHAHSAEPPRGMQTHSAEPPRSMHSLSSADPSRGMRDLSSAGVSRAVPPPAPCAEPERSLPPLLAADSRRESRNKDQSREPPPSTQKPSKPRPSAEEVRRAEEAKRKRAEEEARAKRLRDKRLELVPPSRDGAQKRLTVESELIAPYYLANPLPEVPCDPKLLQHARDLDSLVRYRYDTPMESSFPYELTCEPDLGIEIDLVDPSLFLAPPGANLAQEDAELLAMAAPGGGGAVGSAAARVKSIRSEVTWLRKTPLMGNNLYESVGYGKHADRAIERKFVVTQKGAATDGAQTLAQVVESIDRSFDDAEGLSLSTLRHPSNPSLTPVAMLPVLPDEKCWDNDYVQMEFDFDPSLEAAGDPTPKYSPARVRKALMRGFSQAATGDTPQRSYVAYLLPQSGKDADGITSGEAQELEWVREYGHAIKNIAEGEGEELAEGAVFYFAEGSQQVVYNQMMRKMDVTRRRFRSIAARPSSIRLTRRALAEDEEEERQARRQRISANSTLLLTHQAHVSDGSMNPEGTTPDKGSDCNASDQDE